MGNTKEDQLRIGTIAAGGGRIGLTLCPGKKESGALSGNHNRDLKRDLEDIAAWGASCIVSVIEQSELETLCVPNLGETAEALGLNWYHLPVADVSAPGADFEAWWVYVGHQLRKALSQGEGVLIHCKGGLGRTGTVAARMLVELGERPAKAIAKVREARGPHAIETAEQEHYVHKCSAIGTDRKYADRVLGCLLGGAVGDALGYAVEFTHWDGIKHLYGDEGIREPELRHGIACVSDDTQMTLFTLEGMLRAFGNPEFSIIAEIRRAYADWLATQERPTQRRTSAGVLCRDPRLQHVQAPGNTCLTALRAQHPVTHSKGCGGVMRVAPLGLTRRYSAEEAFRLGAEAAALTHGHPTGYLSAGSLACMIRSLLDSYQLSTAVEATLSILRSKPQNEETRNAIVAAIERKLKRPYTLPAVADLGAGWVAEEALSIALHSTLLGKTFPEILAIAANHDGDSDSTASIAGQIYGAWHGLADLPNQWIRRIDVLIPLLTLAGELIEREGTAS